MERLTFEGNFCDIAQCSELPCKHGGNCTQRQVRERLKQFEDVFKTPEKATWAKQTIEMAFSDDPSEVERLRELYKADKDGRLVVLPCKVGGTAYYLNGKFIIDFEVIGYMVDERGAWSFMGEHYEEKTEKTNYCDPETEKIGKTVFLTREEAEKALQEMEGKKDD